MNISKSVFYCNYTKLIIHKIMVNDALFTIMVSKTEYAMTILKNKAGINKSLHESFTLLRKNYDCV